MSLAKPTYPSDLGRPGRDEPGRPGCLPDFAIPVPAPAFSFSLLSSLNRDFEFAARMGINERSPKGIIEVRRVYLTDKLFVITKEAVWKVHHMIADGSVGSSSFCCGLTVSDNSLISYICLFFGTRSNTVPAHGS